MKIKLLLITLIIMANGVRAQSDTEVASVYIKKAERSYRNADLEGAMAFFQKAINLMDEITESRVARLGMMLNYDQGRFFEARSYTYDYFKLADKESPEYEQTLELSVDINEQIEKFKLEQKQLEEERRLKAAEAKRLDSLKGIWKREATKLTLQVDKILDFNTNNIALYKKNGVYGIMNDVGTILHEASDYRAYISYDGFLLLLSDKVEPERIYCYDTVNTIGYELPSASAFNATSTNYGKVMFPRGNGLLVTYPNNATKAFVYNLRTKAFVSTTEDLDKELLKTLKKNDIIDKYNNDNQIKKDKVWSYLGGNIGGGLYALYEDKNKLYGFLNTSSGKILLKEYYNYIGAFYNGVHQIIEDNNTSWMDGKGIKKGANANENGSYKGRTKIVKLANGNYQLHQNRDGKNYLVLGEKKLLNQEDFVVKASSKK